MRNKGKARRRARAKAEAIHAEIAIAQQLREGAEAAAKTDPVAAAKLVEAFCRLDIVRDAAKAGRALRFPTPSRSAQKGWRRGPCR